MSDEAGIADEVRRRELSARLRVENPELYKQYSTMRYNTRIIWLIGLIIIGLISISIAIESEESLFWGYVTFIVGAMILNILLYLFRGEEKILREYEDELIRRNITSESAVERVGKLINEDTAFIKGDQIIAHEGAVIINRSEVKDSFNRIESSDPELARAVKILTGYIEDSGNGDAAKVFSRLAKELAEECEPSVIRTFWNELKRLLPDITKLTSAAAAITKFWGLYI